MNFTEINLDDFSYPPLLKEIVGPPSKLFWRGNSVDFGRIFIGIVGTRKATSEGLELARRLSRDLVERDCVVVSGLAMGIDTAAHEGALSGNGLTLAVMGNGIDSIYPAQNENLAKKILARGGAIISEYPPGAPAYPSNFLARNRIIAGLCGAIVVVEAPEKSGALVTARLGAEYGREVFVLPGRAGDFQYKGSHKLIRDGARMISSAEEIFEDMDFSLLSLAPERKTGPKSSGDKMSLEKTKKTLSSIPSEVGENPVFSVLKKSSAPMQIDKIAELTKLEPKIVNQKLSELVVAGFAEEGEKGYSLKKV